MQLPYPYKSSVRANIPPLEVYLTRDSSIESVHKVHAVVSDSKGRILMHAGQFDYDTFIRSALKPFQAISFLCSGASEQTSCGEKGVAISCASHKGTSMHAREAFKILWNADIDISCLKCPIPEGKRSPLEHNCSGKHAAFLATCKKMGWTTDDYLNQDHPLQREITRQISDMLNVPNEELLLAKDDCGAPTMKLQLSQMSTLYAHLSSSKKAELVQISRAMLAFPELIAGKGRFDTELMNRSHSQLISKGGAEGIQCISRVNEGIGIAIKVEDGAKRAKHAVALHLLNQLEWITPTGLQEMQNEILNLKQNVDLEVKGQLKFQT